MANCQDNLNMLDDYLCIPTEAFINLTPPQDDFLLERQEIDVSAHHFWFISSFFNELPPHEEETPIQEQLATYHELLSHEEDTPIQEQLAAYHEDSTQLEQTNEVMEHPLDISEQNQDNDDQSNDHQQDHWRSLEENSKKRREDNNYFKKFVTFLNLVLKNKKYVAFSQAIKKLNKQKKIKSKKSLRYGFIIKLIDLANVTSIEILQQIKQSFTKDIFKYFEKNMSHCQAFMELIPKFIESFDLFCSGNTKESVQVIYDVRGAKQVINKVQGVEKVLEYERLYRK